MAPCDSLFLLMIPYDSLLFSMILFSPYDSLVLLMIPYDSIGKFDSKANPMWWWLGLSLARIGVRGYGFG